MTDTSDSFSTFSCLEGLNLNITANIKVMECEGNKTNKIKLFSALMDFPCFDLLAMDYLMRCCNIFYNDLHNC